MGELVRARVGQGDYIGLGELASYIGWKGVEGCYCAIYIYCVYNLCD